MKEEGAMNRGTVASYYLVASELLVLVVFAVAVERDLPQLVSVFEVNLVDRRCSSTPSVPSVLHPLCFSDDSQQTQ
jgi:hypothetical protein